MKIGIIGCAGRMGRMLVQEVLAQDGASLSGGTETVGHDALGKDVAAQAGAETCGFLVTDCPDALFATSDAIIDFTSPDAVLVNSHLAAEHRTALIVGTTGLQAAHKDALAACGKTVPVVQAANMSIGVNLLLGLTQQVAAVLGEDYDIEIVEMHHRHKVDAPSGTALALGRAAAEGRGTALESVSRRVRDGQIGARPRGEIGFATLRGGDVVGEHSVILAAEGERIELTHKASSRSIFARGAVHAALWTAGRSPGLYSMRQVLGFE